MKKRKLYKKIKKFLKKEKIRNYSHWAIFVMVAVTMTLKIMEISAYESLKLLIDNPELASQLIK